MRTVIVLGNIENIDLKDLSNSYLIGVEYGAYHLIELGMSPDLAIGDFDSVDIDTFKKIERGAKKLIKLNPIKDITDTEAAILNRVSDDVLILGGIKGKRIEHFYANLMLLKKYPFITLKDEYSKIFIASKHAYTEHEYKFISIFPVNDFVTLSLHHMKYEVSDYILDSKTPTLGISNEALGIGEIIIKKDLAFVFFTKDDHEKL